MLQEADDAAYLTFKDLSRALCLTVQVISKLVDIVMVLTPVTEKDQHKRGQFNIGLGLRYLRNFSSVSSCYLYAWYCSKS